MSAADDGGAGVEVVATARGYFGHLREPGDRFTVPAGQRLGRWMAPVKAHTQAPSDEPETQRAPRQPKRSAAV